MASRLTLPSIRTFGGRYECCGRGPLIGNRAGIVGNPSRSSPFTNSRRLGATSRCPIAVAASARANDSRSGRGSGTASDRHGSTGLAGAMLAFPTQVFGKCGEREQGQVSVGTTRASGPVAVGTERLTIVGQDGADGQHGRTRPTVIRECFVPSNGTLRQAADRSSDHFRSSRMIASTIAAISLRAADRSPHASPSQRRGDDRTDIWEAF